MFWGLMLKANRKYSQTIQKPFHLSQAALDVKSCTDNSPVQVLLTSNKSTYVLCTLRLNSAEQVPLDLNFEGGAEISFASQGAGNVHLTGYLVEDYDDFGEDAESDLENVEDGKINEPKKNKKEKKELKKSIQNEDGSSDDDEEEDEDDEEGDEEAMNEEDSDEDEEVADSDDDEESDDDSEEEEEVQEPKSKQQKLDKPKQNGVEKQQPNKKGKKDQPAGEKKVEKNLQGGVKIEDIKIGSGPEAKSGKKVNVYYAGRLKSNNKLFDSSLSGSGFKFSLGRGEVIKGWDIGVVGMKVGGKRRIVCPPQMAYGAKGSPPVIPPNSTLVFEVELKNVN